MLKTIVGRINRWVPLGLALCAGAVGAYLFWYYIVYGGMNADEGYYAIAARSVMDGKLPYRDFAYTQMPILPYLNGLAMQVVGFGLTAQRCVNAFWVLLGMAAVFWAMRVRLGRWEPGFLAVFALLTSPHLAYFSVIGKTYGAALMFVAFALAVLLAPFSLGRKTALFLACAVGAIGVRLSCAPFMAVMGLWLIVEAPSWKSRGIVAGIAVVTLLAVFGAFFAVSPKAAFFDVWQYHMESSFLRPWKGRVSEWWRISPTAIVLLMAGWACVPALVRKRDWGAVILLVAALVSMILPMLPKSAYGEYVTPSVVLASVAGVYGIWRSCDLSLVPARNFIWLLPLIGLALPLPKQAEIPAAENLEQVAAFISEQAAPGPVLTPMPILAVEAGREVIPRTEMGMFCAMAPNEAARAREFRYTTLPELAERLKAKEAAAVALLAGQAKWNFKWIAPSLRRQPPGAQQAFQRNLESKYQLAKRFGNIVVYLPR